MSVTMGFIDWHGNKENHYDEVIEFAKMKEIMEAENFGSQMKKKADAEFFGVPEVAALRTSDMLKLLVKEQRAINVLHKNLVRGIDFDEDEKENQFYKDAWLYMVGDFLNQANLDANIKIKLTETFMNQIFNVNNITAVEKHFDCLNSNKVYQKYIEDCFVIKTGRNPVFWQWIGYMDSQNLDKKQGVQLAKLYQLFLAHFAFYLNQIIPNQNIGKLFVEKRAIYAKIIQKSLTDYKDYSEMIEKMENPLYKVVEEPVVEQPVDKKKIFKQLLKYVKIILCNCTLLKDGEEDMITAGYLYTSFNENKIQREKIASIFPYEFNDTVTKNTLPVLSTDEIKFALEEGETLHYLENAIMYRQDVNDEELFRVSRGVLFITNKRVRFETGSKTVDAAIDTIAKVAYYEALPEILQFETEEKIWFVQTAKTDETYQFLKVIMKKIEEPESVPVNMEKVSFDFFEKENMDAYIFGIKSMFDEDMPQQMQDDILLMIKGLENLDKTLQMYPSHEEQAHRFFTYYIPEVMRLIYSFNEYEKAGVSEERMNPVYDRVMKSIHKVSTAAVQRVDEIYKMATMDTMAKADALQKIIGQDGYAEGDKPLKH